jgi:hypothetical protein
MHLGETGCSADRKRNYQNDIQRYSGIRGVKPAVSVIRVFALRSSLLLFATYCFGTYQGIGRLIFCVVLLSPFVSHSQAVMENLAPAEFNSQA